MDPKKRENKIRVAFNDKIVKVIKSRYFKQIYQQKIEKLDLCDEGKVKLKKVDRKILKV